MPYKYCQHVRENGTFCAAGAVRGRRYCYFHLRTRARRLMMAQAQSQQKPCRPEVPPLEDMHAVQVALMDVLDGLASGALERDRAGLMLYGLQQAASNVRHLQAWLGASRFDVGRDEDRSVGSYPGLEAEFGLPENTDLDARPEELFPPPVTVPGAMTSKAWLVAVHNALRDSGQTIDPDVLRGYGPQPAPALRGDLASPNDALPSPRAAAAAVDKD